MVADAYICMLEERFDGQTGKLRWSLPRNEICHCQGVVAPSNKGHQSCSRENAEIEEDLWFTDNPTPLVNRRNWEPAKLDKYLNRTHCCTFNFECFCYPSFPSFTKSRTLSRYTPICGKARILFKGQHFQTLKCT